jgi:hypothetical protein
VSPALVRAEHAASMVAVELLQALTRPPPRSPPRSPRCPAGGARGVDRGATGRVGGVFLRRSAQGSRPAPPAAWTSGHRLRAGPRTAGHFLPGGRPTRLRGCRVNRRAVRSRSATARAGGSCPAEVPGRACLRGRRTAPAVARGRGGARPGSRRSAGRRTARARQGWALLRPMTLIRPIGKGRSSSSNDLPILAVTPCSRSSAGTIEVSSRTFP